VPDQTFKLNEVSEVDTSKNYNELTSSIGTNVIDELNRIKKDKNLNVDYSLFENHTFFGSAESKLKNFKTKMVTLEGLFSRLNTSLSVSSSQNTIARRKDLFKQIKAIQDDFTSYEHFLYNDGQSFSTASAPGHGTNLAGTNFNNNATNYSSSRLTNVEGFETLHQKTTTDDRLHLFRDVYNAQDPPFYNTNRFLYLSFILKGQDDESEASSHSLTLDGGHSNLEYDSIREGYSYLKNRRIPYDAFSGSAELNPVFTGSHYQRYVFKAQQNFWRPAGSPEAGSIPIVVLNVIGDSAYTGSSGQVEVLSGSNPTLASTPNNSFSYTIIDSTGQHTPFFFPNYIGEDGIVNSQESVVACVMPQGDLFPIYVNSSSADFNVKFTDVNLSYNDPTNIHPFSKVVRPPSGSYAGSTEWNSWYDSFITEASDYDNDNIHSLVNNLPMELRTAKEHQVLRDFVNMLGEEFDLLRNYIDNYHNFYKLGYKDTDSIPNNLLPIFGDSLGWKLFNPFSGSFNDYLTSNKTDSIGIQGAINSTWKKILNNLVYIYKTKGSVEAIRSLLNMYGFDSNSFNLNEYGGSIEEHNPTIIKNTAEEEKSLKSRRGNVSFVEEVKSFPMLNLSATSNFLKLDWWSNDAKPNGIEFVFNPQPSNQTQTILRSSGSSNDLWDLRVVASGSSTTTGSLQFRLNYSNTGSHALASNAISMSTDNIAGLMGSSVFNVMLQRQYVTSSYFNLTQSYHMFIARKDGSAIKDMQAISMSSHGVVAIGALSSSHANQNFIDTGSLPTSTTKNLFVGESLSGSIAEVRAWDAYVSESKFKQHVLNYESVVGGTITSSRDDIIYRFPMNEKITNWERTPNSASLKLNDVSSKEKVKDFTITIADQPDFNFQKTATEQKFFKFAVKGMDTLPNDNQTNLVPRLKSVGSLSPTDDNLVQPQQADGTPNRIFENKFGKSLSYVSAIDSLLMNVMPDFSLDDYIGSPDESLSETYSDLENLRKAIITDSQIGVDVTTNQRAAETIMENETVNSLNEMIPAKSKLDFQYDVKNDALFRSKRKPVKLLTLLNPNKGTGIIDADKWDEPTLIGSNQTIHSDIIEGSQLTVTGSRLEEHADTIDTGQLLINATANENFKVNNDNRIEYVTTTGIFQKVHYGQLTGSAFTDLFLGSKNEFYKNWGTSSNNTFFYSRNPGNDGLFNTYKYESRFTFKTIGDTEVFMGSESIHDNFRLFENRHFVDKSHVEGYEYDSFFGDGGNGTVTGRMVGRTRFFKTDSDGNITYPSNHFINARTSKDVLLNLIYKGTQLTTSSVRPNFPPEVDVQPASPAYRISVGGSDTINRIKVERPVSSDNRNIRLLTRGPNTDLTFTLLRRAEVIFTQNLNTTGTGAPNDTKVQFSLTGRPTDYQFKITGLDSNRRVRRVSVIDGQNASFAGSRTRGRFTNIRGDFGLRIEID